MARALGAFALVALLAGCTAARLAYKQAPNLTYWWLDSHVDIASEQSFDVRNDIDAFFQWHRREELPVYAGLLRDWQAMALRDIEPREVCMQAERVRARLQRAGERMAEPMARLALQLSPAQIDHLQRHQAKGNEGFAKDFVRGTPEQRLERRFERALDRSEMLYGPLDAAQQRLLRERLAASPWDPQRALQARLRRQQDQIETVRRARADPARAGRWVREHIERIARPPSPDEQADTEAALRHGCALLAQLHNRTTPEQRAHAVRVLQDYESDLRVLAAQR